MSKYPFPQGMSRIFKVLSITKSSGDDLTEIFLVFCTKRSNSASFRPSSIVRGNSGDHLFESCFQFINCGKAFKAVIYLPVCV